MQFEKKKKNILNVPRYFSNNYVCDILSVFTFEHFINIELIRFMLWQSKYNVPDVLTNDIDALVSGIDFIQKRESSSMYIPLILNT